MNEKTNLQDLAALIAERSSIAIKDVEYFLRELVETIQQALLNDETVRIKNFGTFKRLAVSARESIDVTTGNRVVLPAHYKINFIPDNNLAQAINEPFASFGPVEVDEVTPPLPLEPKINIVNEKYQPAERRPVTVIEEAPKINTNPDKIPYSPTRKPQPKKRRDTRWISSLFFGFLVLIGVGCVAYLFIADKLDKRSSPVRSNKGYIPPTNYEEEIVGDTIAIDNIVEEDTLIDENNIVEEDSIRVETDSIREETDSISTIEDNRENSPAENVEQQNTSDEPAVKTEANETTDSSTQYTLRRGDRLTSIAQQEYGHKVFWVYLYEENKDKIKNPDNVPVDLVITIPPASKYGIDKDKPASVQEATALQQKILQENASQQRSPQQRPSQPAGPLREYQYDEYGFPY